MNANRSLYEKQLRIGLIVLATDPTPEMEFREMLHTDKVGFFVSRVDYENPVTTKNLHAMKDDLTRATSHILPDSRLDVIAYACTSGAATIGVAKTYEYIRKARANIPCTTPITAACKGFAKLNINKIALITPYKPEVDKVVKDYIEEQDISVVKNISFNLESDVEIARFPQSSIYDAACEIDSSEVEGIFISCTALRAAGTIELIEEKIGKPVITSNQAMLWDALRIVGYNEVIHGYGKLMYI